MAINKKLIHFKTKNNFNSEVAKDNVLDLSICFIQDSKEISTHGTLYKSVNWSVLSQPISLCDIAYWDGSAVKTVSKDKWDTSLGTPIGVIVIPEGMLPDGKARMVGLTPVDENGNSTGTYYHMTWGGSGTNTSLKDYVKVPITDNAGSTSTGSNNGEGYLPSDNFNGTISYVDSRARYKNNSKLIPSPYLYNGGELIFNPEYSKEISGGNAFSDFNGLSNTETLVGLGSNYQAANAAWKYSDGVSNTKWYLPAMGELGFLIARLKEINNVLTLVRGVLVADGDSFYGSTEYGKWTAYIVHTYSGYVQGTNGSKEYDDGSVRVFGIIN